MITNEIEYGKTILCPICNKPVIPDEAASITPCPHTLIIATDEGFEYASEHVDIIAIEEMINDEDMSWGEGLGKLDRIGEYLLSRYQPSPSFFGVYVLFSGQPGKEYITCPACISQDIECLETQEKIMGLGLYHLHDFMGAINKIEKNYRCQTCGYTW